MGDGPENGNFPLLHVMKMSLRRGVGGSKKPQNNLIHKMVPNNVAVLLLLCVKEWKEIKVPTQICIFELDFSNCFVMLLTSH